VWTAAGGKDHAGKPRPVVIVQDDRFHATDSITICAFTSDPTDAPLLLDLFYRLRVFPIVVPPLRERREDVAPLAQHFLERIARDEKKPIAGFHAETIALLERHTWPGNVRELENEVQRLVLCAEPNEELAPDALAPWVIGGLAISPATEASLRELMRQVETAIIQSRLREHGYRRTETARSLGITRESLWAKLRALGLTPPGST
jgi:Nif-specific regulatory protein